VKRFFVRASILPCKDAKRVKTASGAMPFNHIASKTTAMVPITKKHIARYSILHNQLLGMWASFVFSLVCRHVFR
jgi:hypothetical protein